MALSFDPELPVGKSTPITYADISMKARVASFSEDRWVWLIFKPQTWIGYLRFTTRLRKQLGPSVLPPKLPLGDIFISRFHPKPLNEFTWACGPPIDMKIRLSRRVYD